MGYILALTVFLICLHLILAFSWVGEIEELAGPLLAVATKKKKLAKWKPDQNPTDDSMFAQRYSRPLLRVEQFEAKW